MRTTIRVIVAASVVALAAGVARADDAKSAKPPMDPAKQAAMEKMMKLGSPSEAHKVFEPLAGNWTYTGQFWMDPASPPETMTGTGTNSLIYGGRFLKEEFRGQSPDQPPFEGTGYLGYDNIRKEYTSIWLDNMSTGVMISTGQYDPATKSIAEKSDFSCPITGETHRQARAVWTIVDQNHNTYTSYMTAPDGHEFKAMELRYTRTQ